MATQVEWTAVCTFEDLVPESGVAVWTKDGPVAVFYLPGRETELLAISHTDPFTGANVLARGITGDLKGQVVVASPLYKQHFNLETGQCLEDEAVKVKTYQVTLKDDRVVLAVPATEPETEVA